MSEQSEQIHFETALDAAGNRVVKATTEGHTTNLSTWSDLAQFLNVSMELKPEKQETIWVMDSDICDWCGGLIGDFGICLDCGDDGVDWDEEEDDFVDFGDSDEDQEEIGTFKHALTQADAEFERRISIPPSPYLVEDE